MPMSDISRETVIEELERRNEELSAMLRSSEKSRDEIDMMMREQNNELTTLRANNLIMGTLEEEIKTLNGIKTKFLDQSKTLEGIRKQDQTFRQKIYELEAEKDEVINTHTTKTVELLQKMKLAHDMIKDKDEIITKMENTVKNLFEKCNKLGVSNKDIKEELKKCIESENYLKEFSMKIQYNNNYLEKEIEQLVKESKLERASKEEVCGELASARYQLEQAEKQVKVLNEEREDNGKSLKSMKELLDKTQKMLTDYESGEVKSTAWLHEIHHFEQQYEDLKTSSESKLQELEHENEVKEQDIKRLVFLQEKLKGDAKKLESKIISYDQNYIRREEVEKLQNELELKYKIEMNKQLQKVSSVFEQEQGELLQTMRASIAQRRGTDAYDPSASRPSSRSRSRTSPMLLI